MTDDHEQPEKREEPGKRDERTEPAQGEQPAEGDARDDSTGPDDRVERGAREEREEPEPRDARNAREPGDEPEQRDDAREAGDAGDAREAGEKREEPLRPAGRELVEAPSEPEQHEPAEERAAREEAEEPAERVEREPPHPGAERDASRERAERQPGEEQSEPEPREPGDERAAVLPAEQPTLREEPRQPAELADRSVAHYRLLERIGEGGLGEVFRARDTREGRTIALKLVPAEIAADPDRRERFLKDARAAAALSHPAIALLFEAGEFEDRVFLAFEFVPGETLRRELAHGPMHPKRAVPIAIQVADALAEAHAAGIVHRDLTPDNIMVTPKGAVKVLDFGLASWTRGGAARQAALTEAELDSATVTGTVAYVSPEQALGQQLDHRTDLFSLGVVIYEMLTGRNPFAGTTATATIVNILKVKPEPPGKVNAEVPAELDAVVLRLLSRDVQSRYADAATVASDLRAAYAERTETVFEADVSETVPGSPRRIFPWVLVALLVVLLAAAALAYPRRDAIRGWWRHTFGSPPAPIVAVMPLREAGQRDTDFADGFTEDLIMRLGQTPGIRVPGRTAARAARGRQPADVAKRTGASVLLTGTIERAEGDVRVDLELIDPADGLSIWRRSFINPMGNVFVAQALIANEVADALKLEAAPTELNARTMSRIVAPEAYEVYARGRAALARRELDPAVSLFEKAAALDSGLAEAYAGLAEALYRRAVQTGLAWDADTRARVRQAAARAAAIEPELAIVEMAAGLAADSYRETLRRLARAATLDPSNATAYHEIGAQLLQVDSERAARLYERSRGLDAQLPANYPYLFAAEVLLGRPERAARAIDEMERALPGHPRAGLMRARLAARTKDAEAAAPALKEAASREDLTDAEYVGLAQFLAQAGRRPEALATLDAVGRRRPASCDLVALKAGLLRDMRRAAEARALAAPLIATRRPCSALAAAAMADAAAAAGALRAIAGDELSLRPWLQNPFAPHGELALRDRLYPWGNVLDAPEVVKARSEIDAARARLKGAADQELRSLPQ